MPRDVEVPLEGEVQTTLRRARTYDLEAFARLHAWVFPSVYRYCSARTNTREDAEDLTEEVFLAAVQSIANLRTDNFNGVFAWFLRIAKNKVADHYRRRAKSREMSLSQTSEYRDTTLDPEEQVEASVEREALRTALEELTPEQREVVIYKFVLDYDNRRTAQIMKKSPNAINALQHRALSSLRRLLKEETPDA